MDKRQEFINGLRAVADFYENNPAAHFDGMQLSISMYAWEEDAKSAIAATAKAMGKCEKEYDENNFTVRKNFSEIVSLGVFAPRAKVCTPVVVGTKVIPEHVVPATAETHVPERVENVIEWRCEPLLAGGAA